ncbi:hypothetical protein ACP275_02G189200 [Erythranthe tilingii]
MNILKFIFFNFLLFPLTIHSTDNNCPNSYCGNNNLFPINYPFKLQDQQPQFCSNYTNLTCDTQNNNTILNLPFSGDFYVYDIIYDSNSIFLYDPRDCLPGRLMNLSLSSSPFSAIKYENYTFYSCPINVTEELFSNGFQPIDCLRNFVSSTVASSTVSAGEMKRGYGCSTVVTVEIPVEYDGQFDGFGIYSNLRLKWDAPFCKDCQENYDPDQETDKPRSKLSAFIGSTAFLQSALVLGPFLGVSIFACFMAMAARKQANGRAAAATTEAVAMQPRTTTTAAVSPPQTTGGAMTCSDDKNYPWSNKISTFLETREHGINSSCIICFEEYNPQDLIRTIDLCQHHFHAYCIDQWFQKNSSCPVCRTTFILDV